MPQPRPRLLFSSRLLESPENLSDVNGFPVFGENTTTRTANMEHIAVVIGSFLYSNVVFFVSHVSTRILISTPWQLPRARTRRTFSRERPLLQSNPFLLSHSHLRMFSGRPPRLRPRSRRDGLKTGEGQCILVFFQSIRSSFDTHRRSRYQATKDNDYWSVTIHI